MCAVSALTLLGKIHGSENQKATVIGLPYAALLALYKIRIDTKTR